MAKELDPSFEIAIQDANGNQVAGAKVEFFVNTNRAVTIPSTRGKNPSIQVTEGKVSAVVEYGAFTETVEFDKGKREQTVVVPGIAERLGILHLTDLHVGQSEHRYYFPAIKQAFFEDLKRCHESSGPWDVVIFSGDLAFSGRKEQFKEVNEFLEELLELLEKLGNERPIFLAVPGNHDLVRPDKNDPVLADLRKLSALSAKRRTTLRSVKSGAKIWRAIVDGANSKHRDAIEAMFAGYTKWWTPWARRASKRLLEFRSGLLPGEFAATIAKGQCRFAIVGLNTTFLQISGGNFFGKLAVHAQQFNKLKPKSKRTKGKPGAGSGQSWPQTCDAAILVTHQPPDWLAPSNRGDEFEPFIAPPRRFAMHLCGHMHVAKLEADASAGSEARRVALGRSLFGMEPVEEEGMVRLFGYAAYQVRISRMKSDGIVRAWPRKATQTGANAWVFDRDTSFELDQDGGTKDLPANYFRRPNWTLD